MKWLVMVELTGEDGAVTQHVISEGERSAARQAPTLGLNLTLLQRGEFGCSPPPRPSDYATRTESGRPRSSMWFRTRIAMAISVFRRSSVRNRRASPMTRFQRLKNASTRARTLYRDDFYQAMRPCSAMCWRCRSRCVGLVAAFALGTAVERGGTTTAASGVCAATASVTPVWS